MRLPSSDPGRFRSSDARLGALFEGLTQEVARGEMLKIEGGRDPLAPQSLQNSGSKAT